MRRKNYEKYVQVFVKDGNEYSFDVKITKFMKEIVFDAFKLAQKPSLLQVAKALKLDRNRLSRIVRQLNLVDMIKELKEAKKD